MKQAKLFISEKLIVYLLIFLLLIGTIPAFSQIMISSSHKPLSMTICGSDSTFSLLIANTSGGTVSSATLELELPENCLYKPGSIVNAVEQNITNLNNPIFIIPDILNNSTHSIDYNSEIICGYDNSENFIYNVNYNSSNYNGFATPLQNYYYASIVITSITNSSATVNINQSVTRDLTIEQQGVGAALDTLIVIDEHTSDIEILSVNIGNLIKDLGSGPILYDTIIITGSDLPGGNNKFDYGESIILSETVTLLGCTNGQSTINATWGCYGDYCEDHFAYPSVSPASGVPNIDIVFTGNKKGWGFIDNSGYVEFTVTNNGTGAGTAYNLVTLAGFSSGGNTYYPNGDWLNEIDSFSVNGNYQVSSWNYASGASNGRYSYYFTYNYTSDPDGPGVGIEDEDGDGIYDDLPVGNSVTVKAHTYYNWAEAEATIPVRNSCGRGWTNNYWQGFRFGYDLIDQCANQSGASWIPNTNTLLFQTYNTKSLEHLIPADIYNGTVVWMEQQVSTNTKVDDEGCPNDSVVYSVVLPNGIVIGGGTATYRGSSMGAPVMSGNTAMYILNKNQIKQGGWFKVPLRTNCNVTHNPTATVETNLRFWCDKTLYPTRFFTYWCSVSPVFGIQCDPGTCVDPFVSDFIVERTTMGWTDNQLSEKVDRDTPGIQLDYAMALDSIKIVSKGVISSTSDSLYFTLTQGNLPGNWSNSLFFNYLVDTLKFFDVETDTWLNCINLNPTITNGSTSELTLNISSLTQPGQCFEGYTYTDGDSLVYSIYGQVRNVARSNWETVPALRSSYYNITDGNKEYCNDKGATFNILGSNYNYSDNTNINPTVVEGCDDLLFYGQIYRWLDDCGGTIAFPNEVRPFLVLDTIVFYLPEGINYHSGSSVHRFRTKNGVLQSESISDPIIEYNTGITKLIYIRESNWSFSSYYDCSQNQDRIQFYATAACIDDPTISYSITNSGKYQFYVDGIGNNFTNTASTNKAYSSSEVVMTPLITTAEGRYDTVFWDVRLCNVTSIDADNNWLAFESESNGIEIIEVIDVTIPTAPITLPVVSYGQGNSWAQLGTLTGSDCNIYTIKAVYSSCSSDSLYVRHAFNCSDYPVNPELGYPPTAYSCNENNTYLFLEPNDVSLNLSVTSPVNPVYLCDTLEYETQVSNTLLSYAYNLSLTVNVPPGVTVVPSLSEFSYPYNSGLYQVIDDPSNIPIGSNNWVYELSVDPNATDILKGIDSLPLNGYKLKFKVITDCDLISGSSVKITAKASNACGAEKTRNSFTSPILIDGLPTNVNLYVLNTDADSFLPTCDISSTVKTKIINLGPNSASDIELLSISIDDAYDYVPGSLIAIHNGPSGISNNVVFGGIRFLSFSIQANLAINDSIVFSYDLIDVDPGSLECDTIPLTTNAMMVASVPCSTVPTGSCDIQSITSSLVDNMVVRKDDVVFGNIHAVSSPFGNNSELITINYSLINSGSFQFNSDSLDIVFVHDANGNGIADETDADSLFFQRLGVENLPVGGSVESQAVFVADYNKVCDMLAAIRLSDDTCICSEISASITEIQLQNAGPDTIVCVQNTIQIGSDTISGQTYIWVPSAYLSSSVISNPEFTYTGSLSQPDTLNYILITNREGNCSSQDSIQIIVYPTANGNAGSDERICESFDFDFSTSTTLPSASNYDSISWYGGTGTFSDPHALFPVYTPGNDELGDVELFLIAYSILNCSQDISSMILTIDTLPDPDFTSIPDNQICVNEIISFFGIDNNNTQITNWLWDFGDGGISTGQDVDHYYQQSGNYDVILYLTNNNTCVDSVSKSIFVNELPDASFVINQPDTACSDLELFFVGSSTTNIISWDWEFGDNTTGVGQNISHTYGASGNYTIQLYVENENTCRDTVVDSIYIRELPLGSIIVSDTSCLNDTVYFEGSSPNNIVAWQWDFGDGNTATGQFVNNVYTASGLYYYSLVFTDIVGCTDTIVDSIFIRLPLTADFIYSPSDTSCVNEQISFTGLSQNNIDQWDWEFGDGNSESGQYVNHDYALAGTYYVLLISTDENGCMDTVIHQVIVDDPLISFNVSPSPICFGDTTYFISTGENITYAPYYWDFGDGIGTDNGYNTEYLYPQSGSYDVSLQVCSKNIIQIHIVNPVCVVDAGGMQATCQDVYFNYANSITPPTAEGYDSIRWVTTGIGYFNNPTLVSPTYFPDPTEGAIQNDTITMRMVGYGIPPCDNDTSFMELIVIPGAFAHAGSDENACIDEPYDLANSVDSAFATNYTSVYWYTTGLGYFNDPAIMRPIYFPVPGELGPITLTMVATNIINCDSIDDMILTYNPTFEIPVDITLCYYDSVFAEGEWRYDSGIYYDTLLSVVGCDSVIVTNLVVRSKIDNDFIISTGDSICRDEVASFIPTGSASIVSQLWDFGNGDVSVLANPIYQYSIPGNYTVIYHYTDSDGCSDSSYRDITVFELPDVTFDINLANGCVNYPVEFTGISNSNIVSWDWDFGDGQTGTGQNVEHTYLYFGEMTITLTVVDIVGCSETTYMNLHVLQASNAEFTYNFFACDSVQFTDLSTSPEGYNIVMWNWDFDDGDTSDLQNPVHVFPTNSIPGGVVYNVNLIITSDSSGFLCSNSITHQVLVMSNPDIFFTWNPEPTCQGDITSFFGGSGYNIDQWYWDFGDGHFATIQNPDHIYSNPGQYNVVLTVTDVNQCTNSISDLISVVPIPDVSFTLSDSVSCNDNNVQFISTTSPNVANWNWEFGDGGISNDQNPLHFYSQPGTYIITLTVIDSAGCSNSTMDQIIILPEPTADFTYQNLTCSNVLFVDLSIAPSGYNIVSWYWDFGDGFSATVQNPSHSYTAGVGIYDVKLIVVSDSSGFGCVDSITKTVLTPGLPSVFFTWNPEPTFIGDQTDFFGTSGNIVTNWYWDFGDGYFATTQNTGHTYEQVGTYDVVLTITDIDGCQNSVIHQVTVAGRPELDYTWTRSCEYNPVQFSILSPPTNIPEVISWSWNFGDGGTSTDMEPIHTYYTAGVYTVSLTIVDITFASNTLEKQLTVHPLPISSFGFDDPTCVNNEVQFYDNSSTSSGNLVGWNWDFGDGNTQTIVFPDNPNVTHTYSNVGSYNVVLTVSNTYKCQRIAENTININSSPEALFSYNSSCAGNPINFTDNSVENGGSEIVEYYWDFGDPDSGDENISDLQNPAHIYSTAGDYDVLLIATNLNGCADSTITTITVYEEPEVDFTYTDACLGLETTFNSETDVGILEYSWSFGDGGSSSDADPVYIYANSGDYIVTLIILSDDSCIAEKSHIVHVNPLPNPNFDNNGPSCLDQEMEFTDLSVSPNGLIEMWEWNFGDGSTTTINAPDDPNVVHLYTTDGTYSVILTVTDEDGCENEVSIDVEVVSNPIADYSFEENCFGDPVLFTDISSDNGGTDIQLWQWFFGDPASGVNNTSNIQNPTHIFSSQGTYTTTLIVSNTTGCSDTTEQEIIVDPLPSLDFTIANDSVCLGELAYFTGIGSDINTWYWEFGDGGTSIEQNTSYMYAAPGLYYVTLSGTDSDGCVSIVTRTIMINGKPEANFEYINSCVGDSTYFTDLSYSQYGFVVGWSWDFGDGNISTLEDPTHLYQSINSYNVKLIVTDNYGCMDTIIQSVQVFDLPQPQYSWVHVCNTLGQVDFFDESTPGGSNAQVIGWNWDFDDGNYSTQINPSYIFEVIDTCYTVILTVTDENGCSATDSTTEVCISQPTQLSFYCDTVCFNQNNVLQANTIPGNDSILLYIWNFNDGAQPFETPYDTVNHVFAYPGPRLVELTVIDLDSCYSTVLIEIMVDSLPTAMFENTVESCSDTVKFTDLSFTGGADLSNWHWEFGDIISGADNVSFDQNPGHVFGLYDSTYFVNFTTSNINGCINSITQEVFVEPCLVAGFESGASCTNRSDTIVDTSYMFSHNGEIEYWYWDFGDGSVLEYGTDTIVDTIYHVYDGAGDYYTSLTIRTTIDGVIYTDTKKHYTPFLTPADANFSFENICFGDTVRFFDQTKTNGTEVTSWRWNFSDDSFETDTMVPNPYYVFPDVGTYEVMFKIHNNNGCCSKIFKDISIYNYPVADFTSSDYCAGSYTHFFDSSESDSSEIISYQWDFSDTTRYGDTLNRIYPQHIYDSAGVYNVSLKIIDEHKCFDSIDQDIEINPLPISDFIIVDTNQTGQVYLENISEGATDYIWDFNYDYGEISYDVNPIHQFEESGTHNIMLVSFTEYGCSDTTYQPYDVLFTNLFVPNAFVPSSDIEELQTFKPVGVNLSTYKISIYSAWGNLVFESTKLENGSPAEGWNGRYEGNDLPTGIYLWRIYAIFKDGSKWEGTDNGDGNTNPSGAMTLIR